MVFIGWKLVANRELFPKSFNIATSNTGQFSWQIKTFGNKILHALNFFELSLIEAANGYTLLVPTVQIIGKG